MKKLPLKSHTTFFTEPTIASYHFAFPHKVEFAFAAAVPPETCDMQCSIAENKVTVHLNANDAEIPREVELWIK